MRLFSRQFIAVSTLAVCGWSAVPALANDPPVGSRLGERLKTVEKVDRARAVGKAHRLSECLVNRRGDLTRRYLNAATVEQAEDLRRSLFNSTLCSDETESSGAEESIVYIPDDLARGYLSEAYVEKKTKGLELAPVPGPAVYTRPWFAATTRDSAVDEMSVCSVETNPSAVLAILRADPITPEEGKAFAGIGETLGKCLRVGAKLTGNRESLRASLAEALFHKLYPAEAQTVEAAE